VPRLFGRAQRDHAVYREWAYQDAPPRSVLHARNFWPRRAAMLSGSGAASEIGLINSLGNLGASSAPWFPRRVSSYSGSITG
jgi:hypothetical protein